MKRQVRGIIKKTFTLSLLLSFVYSILAVPYAEAGMWEERRESVYNMNKETLLASLPAVGANLPGGAVWDGVASVDSFSSLPNVASDLTAAVLQSLPLAYANFKSAKFPKNWKPADGMVIQIQDVHMNPEAQANIGKTIQVISEQGKADLVALEGAFKDVDVSGFRKYEDQDAVRMAADYFLKEGKLSGAIHAALTAVKVLPAIVGVDDKALHAGHINAYRESIKKAEVLKIQLAREQAEIEKAKQAAFSKDLLEFDRKVEEYRRQDLKIGDYVKLLTQEAQATPQVDTFLKALAMEKGLDFGKVEQERSALIQKLVTHLTKEQISQVLNASLAYRLGKVHHTDFYIYLQGLCKKEGVPLKNYPSMDGYIRYVVLSDSIQAEKFLEDVQGMEQAGYKKLARTKAEKELVKRSRAEYLTGKLADFALMPEEWKEYSEIRTTRAGLESFESFFKHAELRDKAMSEKLIKVMSERSPTATGRRGDRKGKTVVLVTGGYHSDGIQNILDRNGLAVVTLSPKITKLEGKSGTEYLSVFTQEKTPLEKLFDGDKLFVTPQVAPPSLFGRIAVIAQAIAEVKNGLINVPSKVETDFIQTVTESNVALEISDTKTPGYVKAVITRDDDVIVSDGIQVDLQNKTIKEDPQVVISFGIKSLISRGSSFIKGVPAKMAASKFFSRLGALLTPDVRTPPAGSALTKRSTKKVAEVILSLGVTAFSAVSSFFVFQMYFFSADPFIYKVTFFIFLFHAVVLSFVFYYVGVLIINFTEKKLVDPFAIYLLSPVWEYFGKGNIRAIAMAKMAWDEDKDNEGLKKKYTDLRRTFLEAHEYQLLGSDRRMEGLDRVVDSTMRGMRWWDNDANEMVVVLTIGVTALVIELWLSVIGGFVFGVAGVAGYVGTPFLFSAVSHAWHNLTSKYPLTTGAGGRPAVKGRSRVWVSEEITFERLRAIISTELPEISSLIEVYETGTLTSDEKLELRSALYDKIRYKQFKMWKLRYLLERTSFASGSYLTALERVFKGIGYEALAIRGDYSTFEKAKASVMAVIEREWPDLIDQYKRFGNLTPDQRAALKTAVSRITFLDFKEVGLRYAVERTPYFNGSHIVALQAVFPEIGLTRKDFRSYRLPRGIEKSTLMVVAGIAVALLFAQPLEAFTGESTVADWFSQIQFLGWTALILAVGLAAFNHIRYDNWLGLFGARGGKVSPQALDVARGIAKAVQSGNAEDLKSAIVKNLGSPNRSVNDITGPQVSLLVQQFQTIGEDEMRKALTKAFRESPVRMSQDEIRKSVADLIEGTFEYGDLSAVLNNPKLKSNSIFIIIVNDPRQIESALQAAQSALEKFADARVAFAPATADLASRIQGMAGFDAGRMLVANPTALSGLPGVLPESKIQSYGARVLMMPRGSMQEMLDALEESPDLEGYFRKFVFMWLGEAMMSTPLFELDSLKEMFKAAEIIAQSA